MSCDSILIFPSSTLALVPMIETVVPILLAVSAVTTYLLQLWTGFAVAGLTGDNALVDRRTKPGPYWFIMAFQTLVMFGIPILIALND